MTVPRPPTQTKTTLLPAKTREWLRHIWASFWTRLYPVELRHQFESPCEHARLEPTQGYLQLTSRPTHRSLCISRWTNSKQDLRKLWEIMGICMTVHAEIIMTEIVGNSLRNSSAKMDVKALCAAHWKSDGTSTALCGRPKADLHRQTRVQIARCKLCKLQPGAPR